MFTDLTESFYNQLLRLSDLTEVHLNEESAQKARGVFSDEQDFQALLEGQNFLQSWSQSGNGLFKTVDAEMAEVDEALKEIQSKPRARKASTRAPATTGKKQKS